MGPAARYWVIGVIGLVVLGGVVAASASAVKDLARYWQAQASVDYLLRTSKIRAGDASCSPRFLGRDDTCSLHLDDADIRRICAVAGLQEIPPPAPATDDPCAQPLSCGAERRLAATWERQRARGSVHHFAPASLPLLVAGGKGRLNGFDVYVDTASGSAALFFH